jgi:REP element-mobilizing transposase RayT
MPRAPWNNWYHVTGSTYGAWLRGDPRGWRSRHHREHVHGDYKNPPPPGTYTRLHNYSRSIMKRDPVTLTWPQRLLAATKMAESLQRHQVELIDLCVSPTHFHILCRFNPPSPGIAIPGLRTPRHLVGIAKKDAARALSDLGLTPPGGIWAVRCKAKPIRNRHHQLRVSRYIPAHIRRGAAVYSIHLKKKNPTPLT